jgi:ABC-type nitrate/sulfonate/bicarbonate transport system substrate-binding protein
MPRIRSSGSLSGQLNSSRSPTDRKARAILRAGIAFLAIAVTCLCLPSPGHAADRVRAGKSLGSLWAFLPLDVGVAEGIYQRYGIDLEISALGNGPKLQQALTSDSIDFGLSAGSDLAFAVKGSPARAVAAFAEEPRSVVVIVRADSSIHDVADLKGKLLAMPGVGSVAEWLVWRMAIAEGWGKNGVKTVAQGSVQANVAALLTGEVDGIVNPVEVGYKLADENKGRIAVHLAQYAPHFHAHVILARDALIKDNPGLVERFLKGFFASVAFMKAHKEQTSEIAMRVLHDSKSIADRTYDYEISMLSDDGSFDPKAITVLKDSFVELGMLDKKPSDDQMLTRRFVPVKF